MRRFAILVALVAASCGGPEPHPVDPNNVDVDGDVGEMCDAWRERCASGDNVCCSLVGDGAENARSCEDRWAEQSDGPVAWDIPCMTATPCAQLDEC